jgi:hypothetical protein
MGDVEARTDDDERETIHGVATRAQLLRAMRAMDTVRTLQRRTSCDSESIIRIAGRSVNGTTLMAEHTSRAYGVVQPSTTHCSSMTIVALPVGTIVKYYLCDPPGSTVSLDTSTSWVDSIQHSLPLSLQAPWHDTQSGTPPHTTSHSLLISTVVRIAMVVCQGWQASCLHKGTVRPVEKQQQRKQRPRRRHHASITMGMADSSGSDCSGTCGCASNSNPTEQTEMQCRCHHHHHCSSHHRYVCHAST